MSDIKTQAWPDFYTAGGTLKLTALSYLERAADKELPKAIERKQFCYILTPRQMGKSSLMVRTKQRLEKVGVPLLAQHKSLWNNGTWGNCKELSHNCTCKLITSIGGNGRAI